MNDFNIDDFITINSHEKSHMDTFNMIEESIMKVDGFKKRLGIESSVNSKDLLKHIFDF